MSLAYAPLRHYQILRQIGGGGTGMTYLARDTRSLREVAVKIIRVDEAFRANEALTGRLEQRFDELMQVIARLVHPRIVPVLDCGLEHGQEALYAFVALPYYAAGSLADWLSQANQRAAFSLSPALIFNLISQTAEVLHYAHEHGVLHQDIKPTNILLAAAPAQSAGFPTFLVTDFGLASFFATNSSRGLSQSMYVRGTAAYLAPEKWDGHAQPASDQYALAVMAFSLLTGTLPFQGTPGQLIHQHREVQPPAPSQLNPHLHPALDGIFQRALAKNPAQRFPSLRAFGQEFARLQMFAGGQPGFPPRVTSPVPAQRPPVVPEQRPVQPSAPGPLAPQPVPPAPPPPLQPSVSAANPPRTANVPANRPVSPAQPANQPGTDAQSRTPGVEKPDADGQPRIPGQADPDATLIGRPSRALAEADPDATLTPATTAPTREQPSPARTATEVTPVPATPPPVREPPSLAGADPDATLITRPSPPLPARPEDRAATVRQPVVQPAPPPPTSAGNAENASRNIPPLPAQTFIPQPGMGIPRVDPPPRNAPAPEFLATPPGPPAEPPTTPPATPKRNIFQTGKTLLLVLLLALIVLAGGGALLVNAVVSSQHTARTGPASVVPGQQKSTASALQHVVNPYAGAQGFLDPDWVARVKAGARQVGGTLGAQEARVAQYSTAVWLTSIASVKGGNHGSRGLAGLLDAAETQAASSKLPIVVTLVLADLPNRNCANPNAQNELRIDNDGLRTYESSYIDAIANTLQQPRYRNLRVVAIIEPGVLATVATDLDKAGCLAASSTYALGIQYALNRLHALPNVYNYLDIAHPDWLGWNDTFHFTVSLMSTIVRGTTDGFESIDGFASNIGNYVPTSEPYLTAKQKIGGKPVRSATFYLGNPYLDMLTYDRAMRQALIASGFPQSIGMLIDTSRNGWGGPDRPTGPSASKDLNTFVNESRIDRRSKRGNWCNQPGGLGARPQADPLAGIAAFVWISRPGFSDGLGTQIPKGKQNPKGLSPNSMCVPGSGQQSTGAMPGSPIAGAWFQAGFNTLVQNAYPPL